MSYNFNSYYQCGQNTYHNIFQAFRDQKSSGHFPQFMLDKDLVNSLTNIKRPRDTSIQHVRDLMVQRLKDLRKKYNKLIIAYSGGTDSYTILRLCIDNDIFVDETVTQMVSLTGDLKTNLEYQAGLELAKQHEGKQIGTCTELHPTESDLEFVDDPDWFYNEKIVAGSFLPFRVYSTPVIVDTAKRQQEDAIVLMGYEKPRLLIEDGKLYWTVTDASVGEMMGCTNTVPFFLDKDNPELVAALTYITIDNLNINDRLSTDQLIGFHTNTHQKQIELLDKYGFYKTPYHFINVGLLGKTKFNFNRKTKRFYQELQKLNRQDFIDKVFNTHKKIFDLYGDLPYAIEKSGDFVKSVVRYSKKIPILQDKFAG